MNYFLIILTLIIGFFLLLKGADYFVDGSSMIASIFNIPQLIIGLTIVAMGTSAPEAAVSINSAIKQSPDISIGNVIGSNILNIFIILGLCSLFCPIEIPKNIIKFELPFLLIVSVVLMILGIDTKINRFDGFIFIFLFVIYIYYLIKKSNDDKEIVDKEKISIAKSIILTLVGIIMVILGSELSVNSAKEMARAFGISEHFIAITIVALGTSLPELITSLIASKKGNPDMAIGNIIGSNIFNILFVLGTSSMIMPINFMKHFMVDGIFMIIAVIVLMIYTLISNKLNLKSGIVLLSIYIAYFIYLLNFAIVE